jgi:GNAT superfamily N-acetyltransferase
MDPMKIERVAVTDAEILNNIARGAITAAVEANDEVKQHAILDTARHIDENISRRDCVFLKFTCETYIVGFILIQEWWNLSDFFVLPARHSEGIGRALFNAAKAICVENSQRNYIRLYSSLNAEGFYRRLGFESFRPDKPYPNFVVPLEYRIR